mgnify:CR=1 FL=1
MTARSGLLGKFRSLLARHIAPPRFLLFLGILAATALAWHGMHGKSWVEGLVVGYDLGALGFAMSLWPLTRDHGARFMRIHSAQNDSNREIVLAITAVSMVTIMAAIGAELPAARHGQTIPIVKLVATLALTWFFTNLIFALHYAHMHYAPCTKGEGIDRGGFEFPGTPEPDYWDFFYFSFTAGMSFAASDVNVTRGGVRRIVVLQSLLSFLFNIGVLAFSINVLAGAAS